VSDPIAEPQIAGWFGKIPALGDFVTRRLPPTFVDPWDAWLSAELVAARRALADAWPSAYRQTPIWRFALTAGAIDQARWLGVLIPSFDRVGRQFPLTIATGGPFGAAQRVWAALVAAGRRALEPSCDADGVDCALRELLGSATEDQAPPDGSHIAPMLEAAAEGSSLWWPWSAEDPTGSAACTFDNLPTGKNFLKLLGACTPSSSADGVSEASR